MQLLRVFTGWNCCEPGRPQLVSWCELKQIRTVLIWTLEACLLLLFCLGLVVVVEYVVVRPRAPQCDIVSLNLTQFSATTVVHIADNNSKSMNNIEDISNSNNNKVGAPGDPIQLLTAIIVITLRASNQIERTGTFYDHVHVMVLYNGEVVGEGLVGPFFQARSDSDLLYTQVEAHKLPVRHDTGTKLLTDMDDHVVDLQVKVHVLTRVRLLKYFTHHFRVHVRCDVTVTMSVAAGLNSTLLSKKCKRKD